MFLSRDHATDTEQSVEYSAEYSAQGSSDPGRGARRMREMSVLQPSCCRCLPRTVRLTFTPESLERLYQNYFRRQRHENLLVLVMFAVLFNSFIIIMCAVVYSEDKRAMVVVAAVGLAADTLLYVLCWLQKLPPSLWTHRAFPYAVWLMITIHVLCYMSLNQQLFPHASDSVGWQAFFTFSIFLTLPLNLLPILLLTVLSCGIHTLVLAVIVAQRFGDNLHGPMLARQVNISVLFFFLMLFLSGVCLMWTIQFD